MALVQVYEFMSWSGVFFVLTGCRIPAFQSQHEEQYGTAQGNDARFRVSPAHFHHLPVSALPSPLLQI
jgi:hypothetical protein